MKNFMAVVMLFFSITCSKHACAQSNNDRLFTVPAEKLKRQFTVELDRGNRMQVCVTDMNDLAYLSNLDSIIMIFLADIAKIKDSLKPDASSRRIDYFIGGTSVNKMKFRKNESSASYFAFLKKFPAILKIDQDSIIISGEIPLIRLHKRAGYWRTHNFQVSFFLNDMEDLAGYRNGMFNEKIATIRQYYKSKWQLRTDDQAQLKKFPEIISPAVRGYIVEPTFINIRKSIEIQNYKNYFVPSVTIMPVFTKNEDFLKREFRLNLAACFAFSRKDSGQLRADINLFLGIDYAVIPTVAVSHRSVIHPAVSIGWLVRRRGEIFDKNSFRFGLGNFSPGNGSTQIQPVFYFNNFFKAVTPSLKVVQYF